MTIGQKSENFRFKPLAIALSGVLFTTLSLITVTPSVQAADASTSSNTMTSTTAPTTTPTDTTTSGTVSPTTSTTSTPPAPTTSTDVKTSPSTVTTSSQTGATPAVDAKGPLNQPNMPDSSVLSWATDAAKSAYSYDFKNYSKQMQSNQTNFTAPGWTAFMAALDKSNNLQVVQTKKLVASAVVVGKPSIVKKGVKNGIYFWKVQVPLLATYESESRLIKQNLLVNMLIIRNNGTSGVGISHFVAVVTPTSQPGSVSNTAASVTPSGTTTTTTGSTLTTPDTTTAPTATGTLTTPAPSTTTGITTTPNPMPGPSTGTTTSTSTTGTVTPSTSNTAPSTGLGSGTTTGAGNPGTVGGTSPGATTLPGSTGTGTSTTGTGAGAGTTSPQ